VAVLALVARLIYIRQISQAPFFALRIGDAEAYHDWASRIAAGDWIGRDVFYQAPLYPYFLAIIYKIFGDGVATVRIVHAVLGASSCGLLAAAGIWLSGGAGAIGGALLAIYPPAIFLDGLLEKSTLVTFLTCALVALIARAASGSSRTPKSILLIGLVLGLLALARENALVLAIPIGFWLAKQSREKIAPGLIPFVAGLAIVLLPVAARNFALGGGFQLTTSQLGANFYIGNHPGALGTYAPLVTAHGSAADEQQDATRLAEQALGRQLTPGEVSRFWTKRALRFVITHPLDWLRQLARKFALTFNAAEVADTESQEIYAEWSSLLRALQPFNFGVVLALGAAGMYLIRRSGTRLSIFYSLVAAYAVSVIAFYVFARYRFPLVPLLLVLVAGGVAPAGPALNRATLATATVIAIGAFAFSHLPLDIPRTARATNYFDLGAAISRDPSRAHLAESFFQRALSEQPDFPAAEAGLATLLTRTNRATEAIPHFRAALASWPDDAEARYNFGVALASVGQLAEASNELEAALTLRPDDEPTRLTLAKIQNNLGSTLATGGRVTEAIPYFERALELVPKDENVRRNLEQARQLAPDGKSAAGRR
jgi:tetratricopeptide (TPR) repeat protein